jgi:hypothetical protein
MKCTDLPEPVQIALRTVPYATIATICPDGRPWNTPVFAVFDDDLSMYWASWPRNQHSLNIAHNPRIFVVVYNSLAPEGEGFGVYLEMTATMLRGKKAIARARHIYTTTFGETLDHEPFTGACPRRLYQATVERIWMNSEAYIHGNFVDIRREIGRN